MSVRRGLQPATSQVALFCLFTGTAIAGVVVLNEPNSDARQAVQSRALEVRKRVLWKALTKRAELLQKDERANSNKNAEQLCQQPGEGGIREAIEVLGLSDEKSKNRLFVVTGPDENLMLSTTQRLSRYMAYSGYNSVCRYDIRQRLVVPCDCRLGTGRFARLLEDQLLQLNFPRTVPTRTHNHDGQTVNSSAAWGTSPKFHHEVPGSRNDGQSCLSTANAPPSSTKTQSADRQVSETMTARAATAAVATTEGKIRLCSWYDSLLLGATRIVMDAQHLDQAALWSIEHALSFSTLNSSDWSYPSMLREETWWGVDKHDVVRVTGEEARLVTEQGAKDRATEGSRSESDHGTMNVDSMAVDSASGRCSTTSMAGNAFCLEIVPSDRSGEGMEVTGNSNQNEKQEEHSLGWRQAQNGLGRELVRWSWGLTQRGLGHVIFASPNPWVLAKLEEILLEEERETRVPLSHSDAVDMVNTRTPAAAATNSFGNGEASDDKSREANENKTLVLMRVALPSAEESEQAVRLVAESLRLEIQLTAMDVAMLADLTGGRRSALEDILLRLGGSSAVTVSEACRAAVDDKALALAMGWGLLSPVSPSNLPEKHASRSATTVSSSSIPFSEEHNGSAGVSSVLEDFRGARNGLEGREWAALWEAMEVLSLPKVTVGAGASPMTPVLPEGAMPPGQLLEACDMDADVLLKLTREGWLEVSPAIPPGSGTILKDPEDWEKEDLAKPEQVTSVYASREHHRQPQQQHGDMSCRHPDPTVHIATVPLKALTRLDNSFVGAAPLILAAFRRMVDLAMNPRADPATPATAVDKLGGRVKIELTGGDDRGGLVVHSGDHARSRASRMSAGLAGSEASDGDGFQHILELEQAGCLIQATVLGGLCRREEEKLAEDGNVLSRTWAELDKARRLLQRDGKENDTSNGEWAEVQLELIRQERAVVATAQEMKMRRARLRNMFHEALALESRAATLPSLAPPTTASPTEDRSPRALNMHPLVRQDGLFIMGAEEAVLSDAENGIRLMPLRVGDFEEEDVGVKMRDNAEGAVGGNERSGGYGWHVDTLWKWLRRL